MKSRNKNSQLREFINESVINVAFARHLMVLLFFFSLLVLSPSSFAGNWIGQVYTCYVTTNNGTYKVKGVGSYKGEAEDDAKNRFRESNSGERIKGVSCSR